MKVGGVKLGRGVLKAEQGGEGVRGEERKWPRTPEEMDANEAEVVAVAKPVAVEVWEDEALGAVIGDTLPVGEAEKVTQAL